MEEPRNPGIVAVKKNLKDKDNYFIISSYSVQEYKNTRIQKYKNTRIQEYKNTRLQEYKNTRIQEEKKSLHMLLILLKSATIKEQFSFKIYNKSKAIPRKNVPVSWQMQRFLI